MDRALIARFTRPPLTQEAWEAALLAHADFVRAAAPSWGSTFTVMEVSGLPMAVFRGRPAGAGAQLNLPMADLRGLPCEFVSLVCAAFPGCIAEGVCFRGATLTYACFTDSRLDGADFSLCKAGDADFSRSSLRGASFRKAVITDADFEGADLTGADFRGARRLDRLKLKDAVLDGVLGL